MDSESKDKSDGNNKGGDKSKKILAIILHYKNIEDTINCIKSTFLNFPLNYSLAIVNNDDNEDGNLKNRISELFQQDLIQYVKTPSNLGFAGGLNYCMQQNVNNYDWFLCLNNDLILDKNTLSKFNEKIDEVSTDVVMIGSPIYDYDERNKIQAIAGKYLKAGGKIISISNFEALKGGFNFIVGACMLIKTEYLKQFGFIPEQYFLYYEETDFCFNVVKNNYKLDIDLNNKVYHKLGGSIGKRSNIQHYYTTRNALFFASKYHKAYLPLVMIKILFRYILVKFIKLDFNGLKYSTKGYLDFLLGRMGKM